MADYISILNRAIAALGDSTEEARRKIYDKARSALMRQLSSMEPALSPEEISKQRLQLEDAIRQVEGGFGEEEEVFEPSPPPIDPQPVEEMEPVPVLETEQETESQAATGQSPDRDQTPMVEAEPEYEKSSEEAQASANPVPSVTPVAPIAPPQPDVRLEPDIRVASADPNSASLEPVIELGVSEPTEKEDKETPTLPPARDPLSDPAFSPSLDKEVSSDNIESVEPVVLTEDPKPVTASVTEPVVASPAGGVNMPNAAPVPELGIVPTQSRNLEEVDPFDEIGEVLASVDATATTSPKTEDFSKIESPEAEHKPISRDPLSDLTGFGDVQANDADFPDSEPEPQKPKSRGGWGKSLVGILILLLLAGGGAFAWAQRDTVGPVFTSLGTSLTGLLNQFQSEPDNSEPDLSDNQPENAVEKDEDRLLDTPTVDEPDPAPEPARDVTPSARTPLPSEEEVAPSPVSPVVEDPVSGGDDQRQEPVAEAQPPETSAPSNPPSSANLFGASAILYEEQAAGSGQTSTSNGSVIWELVSNGSEAIGANGLPSVRGAVTVEPRDLRVRFEILRNLDDSLPASHLIEIEFSGGPLFAGDAINNITGVVLKPQEQQKGQPLAGAVAKVSDNVFWLAMSSSAADLASNTDALKNQNWIDIPVIFQSGKRAILTLEKGAAGDAAIEKAFEDWAQ